MVSLGNGPIEYSSLPKIPTIERSMNMYLLPMVSESEASTATAEQQMIK